MECSLIARIYIANKQRYESCKHDSVREELQYGCMPVRNIVIYSWFFLVCIISFDGQQLYFRYFFWCAEHDDISLWKALVLSYLIILSLALSNIELYNYLLFKPQNSLIYTYIYYHNAFFSPFWQFLKILFTFWHRSCIHSYLYILIFNCYSSE